MIIKLNKFLGNPDVFAVEHRVLNAVAIQGIFLTILTTFLNFIAQLPLITVYFPSFCALIFISLYAYSLLKRNFERLYNMSFSFITLIFYPGYWLINAGSKGGFQYFLFFFLAVIFTSSKTKIRWIFGLLLLAETCALYIIENLYPQSILYYANPADRLPDLLISIVLAVVSFVLALEVFMQIYIRADKKLHSQNQLLAQSHMRIIEQNEEMSAQSEHLEYANKSITAQKETIEHLHRNMSDSINAASRIQKTLLPSHDDLKSQLNAHFILYRPKDVVSGDFYFIKKHENKLILAVADCTGHGVPGAFVSMLGIVFLNEIIRNSEIQTAAQILETLRTLVKSTLKQSGQTKENTQGMDIALCIMHTDTNTLHYAGANIPLYIVRQGQLLEYRPTKNPISYYIKEKNFTNNIIQLQSQDRIYISTDGFFDQFGGDYQSKFLSKHFKEIIVQFADVPFHEQNTLLQTTLDTWKGLNPQNDDITVLGMECI
ncbi:MAG: Phosphoserine phosphatase RsbP [Bacteroidota bacterium]